MIDDPKRLKQITGWKGIRTLVRITSSRQKAGGEKATEEIRLHISSAKGDALMFNDGVRGHWGIENTMHWTLDASFQEDGTCAKRAWR